MKRYDAGIQRSGSLARRVTAFTAACVVVSNMVGTGVFGTTGFMMKDLGRPWLILALWALGGGFALLGALCYSELGAAMPRAGGEYVYITKAYGPIWGFLSGWTSFTIGFSAAIAANALLFAHHLTELLPSEPAGTGIENHIIHLIRDERFIGLAMIWGLTLVHTAGVGPGGFVQRILTIIKVGAILALVGGGLLFGHGDLSNFSTPARVEAPLASSMLSAFLFVSFGYTGWNAAGYIAGEISDPDRNIPRATIVSTVVVTLLYLALNVVYFYALDDLKMTAEPISSIAHKAAAALFGASIGHLITAMLCMSIVGATSAMIWAGPRVYYSMAQDGLFPRFFSGITESSATPARSVMLQSVWVTVLVLSGTFEGMVKYAGFVLIVFTALAVCAVPVLRRSRPTMPRPFSVVGYPLTPYLFLIISVLVMVTAVYERSREAMAGVVTVSIGVPFYFIWKRVAIGTANRS